MYVYTNNIHFKNCKKTSTLFACCKCIVKFQPSTWCTSALSANLGFTQSQQNPIILETFFSSSRDGLFDLLKGPNLKRTAWGPVSFVPPPCWLMLSFSYGYIWSCNIRWLDLAVALSAKREKCLQFNWR